MLVEGGLKNVLTHVIPHVEDLLEDVVDVDVFSVVFVHEHIHHPVVHLHHRLPGVGNPARHLDRRVGVGGVARQLRELKPTESPLVKRRVHQSKLGLISRKVTDWTGPTMDQRVTFN